MTFENVHSAQDSRSELARQKQGATFNIVKVCHSRTDLTSCTTPDSVDATMRTISESWFEQPQPLYWSGLLSEASIPVAGVPDMLIERRTV